MLRLLVFFFLSTSIAFAQDHQDSDKKEVNNIKSDPYAPNSYKLKLELESLGNGLYEVIAKVEVDSGSWFVSPHSAEDYNGHFRITINEDENVQMSGAFDESPRSVSRKDKWTGAMSNSVSVNTTYRYTAKIKDKDDFKVLGKVQFVIEPKCTLEEIPFSIARERGKLTLQQYPKLDKTTCTKKI